MTSNSMMDGPQDAYRRTVTVRIEGRVQGAFYRAWAQQAANRLGLDGWVRNRRDGSVEAAFSGPPAQVDAILKACADGPPDAAVEAVKVMHEGGSIPPGFKVLPTV
jgi:acylphosphatase